MGAWTFVRERVEDVLNEIGAADPRISYIGRPEAASPATGSFRRHIVEQNCLIDEALTLPAKRTPRKKSAKKTHASIN